VTSGSLLSRLGLAIVRPRTALAFAGDRRNPGQSGSDLLAFILILLVATQLRGIVGGIWLGTAVEGSLGLRAVVRILTDTLVVDLGFLVLGAIVIFAVGGGKREIGRSFDLACVAVLPLLFVDLAASAVLTAFDVELLRPATVVLSLVAYLWTAVLVALAVIETRSRRAIDSEIPTSARRAGWAIGVLALAGLAVQGIWLVIHLERVRPMTQGDQAPALFLPHIGPKGEFTTPFELATYKGKVVVLDFWATWCNPCLKAMPHLDQLARRHPEIAVIAINIDEPAEARALFDERQYSIELVFGDQAAQDRYGVTAIPHTVVIDRAGVVRRVFRGGGADLERAIAPLLK
jgi:thiol-disulfide isomerase/thioredoxin